MIGNTKLPEEQGSFPLTLVGSTPEEVLTAGKYDWIADYSRQIGHSKVSALAEVGIEIVLLGSLPERGRDERPPAIDLNTVFTQYDPPEVGDALRFGAQYPDEQHKAPIVFPHEPWVGPRGPAFVLVLRTQGTARGLSYIPYTALVLETWYTWPWVAVRRRGGTVQPRLTPLLTPRL
jgi:hypothetical protein